MIESSISERGRLRAPFFLGIFLTATLATGSCTSGRDIVSPADIGLQETGAIDTGASDTSDGGANGTCELVSGDGCPPEQRCLPDPLGGTVCRAAGSRVQDDPCGGERDECGVQHLCAQENAGEPRWICRRFCRSGLDCDEGYACVTDEPVPGVSDTFLCRRIP